MDHPNAQLARRLWDAIAFGDADGVRAVLAPDLVWRATARGAPWSGTHQGVDAAIDALARIGEATDVFDADLVDVLASDDRIVILFRVHLAIGPRQLDLDYLMLGRVTGERIHDVVTAPLDPVAIEAFWEGRVSS